MFYKTITFRNTIIVSVLWLLLISFDNRNAPKIERNRVLTDTVFYSTFKRASPLKVPTTINSMPNDSQVTLLDAWRGVSVSSHAKNDSLFLYKYICEYDNFCLFKKCAMGSEYGMYKALKWNDSIYILTYYDYDERWSKSRNKITQPKIYLLSFNVNKSEKPVSKLVLYEYEKGLSELWSSIDSDFNIETNHYLSWKDFHKQYPNLELHDISLKFINRKYRLKANGEFELYRYIDATMRGVQYEDQHFSLAKNDTLYFTTAWEKDIHGQVKQLAKFSDKGFILDSKIILKDTTDRAKQ